MFWRAVLRGGVPVAGVVVEFSGGRGSWVQRTYSAARGGGAHLDGARIGVSACTSLQRALLVSAPLRAVGCTCIIAEAGALADALRASCSGALLHWNRNMQWRACCSDN